MNNTQHHLNEFKKLFIYRRYSNNIIKNYSDALIQFFKFHESESEPMTV